MRTGNGSSQRAAGIVAAAGAGARFAQDSDDTPKQFLELGGEPVFVRSIRVVLACGGVNRIACPVPADWRAHAEGLVADAGLSAQVVLLDGGATRQESVRRALETLSGHDEPEHVVIHDAARPLATSELVQSALDTAMRHGAAVVAAPSVDTIAIRSGEWLEAVLERATLVNVQTPQAFRYGLICEAHARAIRDGVADASDDAALVLRLGHRVAVVPGPAANIKITSSVDFELARRLLAGEAL
jgi:2-C-methyl-D-erythritol 4-phosphate cytidylyltransferase